MTSWGRRAPPRDPLMPGDRQAGGALEPTGRFAGIEVCCVCTQAQTGLFVPFSLADFLPER